MGWKGWAFGIGAALVTIGACSSDDSYGPPSGNCGGDDIDVTIFDAHYERCTTFPCTCVSSGISPSPCPTGTTRYMVDGYYYCCGPDSGAPSDDGPAEAEDVRTWDVVGDQTVPLDALVPDAQQPQD